MFDGNYGMWVFDLCLSLLTQRRGGAKGAKFFVYYP